MVADHPSKKRSRTPDDDFERRLRGKLTYDDQHYAHTAGPSAPPSISTARRTSHIPANSVTPPALHTEPFTRKALGLTQPPHAPIHMNGRIEAARARQHNTAMHPSPRLTQGGVRRDERSSSKRLGVNLVSAPVPVPVVARSQPGAPPHPPATLSVPKPSQKQAPLMSKVLPPSQAVPKSINPQPRVPVPMPSSAPAPVSAHTVELAAPKATSLIGVAAGITSTARHVEAAHLGQPNTTPHPPAGRTQGDVRRAEGSSSNRLAPVLVPVVTGPPPTASIICNVRNPSQEEASQPPRPLSTASIIHSVHKPSQEEAPSISEASHAAPKSANPQPTVPATTPVSASAPASAPTIEPTAPIACVVAKVQRPAPIAAEIAPSQSLNPITQAAPAPEASRIEPPSIPTPEASKASSSTSTDPKPTDQATSVTSSDLSVTADDATAHRAADTPKAPSPALPNAPVEAAAKKPLLDTAPVFVRPTHPPSNNNDDPPLLTALIARHTTLIAHRATLLAQRKDLQTRRARLHTKSAEFTKEKEALDQERRRLWEAVLELEGEVEKEEAEVGAIEGEVKRLEGEVGMLEGEVEREREVVGGVWRILGEA